VPDKEAKKPEYQRSLLTLRDINAIEEERRIALKKLFELFDNCMEDVVAELKTPHLSKIDKADALIASITATVILLNELGLEEAPLRELLQQLRNRRLGTPDTFSFDQTTRPNAVGFDKEVIRALIFALYEEKGTQRQEAYRWGKSLLNMNKGQVRALAANIRHGQIETIHFQNLVKWAKVEISKPDFDITLYNSDK
jgi:hypothetical protein